MPSWPRTREKPSGMATLAIQAHRPLRSTNKNVRPSKRTSTRVRSAKSPSTGIGSCHGGAFLSDAEKAYLEKVASMIGTPGKGITACDEGPGTIGDRFAAVGIENTEENRRSYRQILFESPGCEQYLSAAILDPETIYQKSTNSGDLSPRY